MKSNQIRIRVSTRKGLLPFGELDTMIDKKHLEIVLAFMLQLMAVDEANNKKEDATNG